MTKHIDTIATKTGGTAEGGGGKGKRKKGGEGRGKEREEEGEGRWDEGGVRIRPKGLITRYSCQFPPSFRPAKFKSLTLPVARTHRTVPF